MKRNDIVRMGAQLELARRDFSYYCNIKAPDFYKKNRAFLMGLCNELQDFYTSDEEILIVNMPPRHGKSRTVGCLVEWVLGNNQKEKIMTGSYNETLSTVFSKNVRNTIQEQKADADKIIIVMTRWHSKDLAGRALKHFLQEGKHVRHISYKALQADGTMLCAEILSKKSYISKSRAMSSEIAQANYQQNPIDIKGRLYSSFKTYEKLPVDESGNSLFTQVRNYTDTADEGADYLCSITYGVYNKEAYILDILYTKAPMEETEPATAKRLYQHKVNVADIESNNGGRGFARSTERLMENFHSNYTSVEWFHRSKNKQARILSNATWVMNHVYYPVNWRDKWAEYYQAMSEYQREGKNKHDDAPDATTGIAEKIGQGNTFSFN